MSSTQRKLFSYDIEEDSDIHKLFEDLPKRQHSKYIRMGLRLLQEQLEKGEVDLTRHSGSNVKEEKDTDSQQEDDFEDLTDDMLNLGK